MIDERSFSAEALREFFARHERVFMPMNGSVETILLAHCCREWPDKLTLLLARTDAQLPEVVDVAKAFKLWFPLVEVEGMRPAESWRRFGTASDVAAIPFRAKAETQLWTSCCARVRQKPIVDFLHKQEGAFGLLDPSRYIQQFGDVPSRGDLSERIEVLAPFWGLKEERIASAFSELGLRAPQVVVASHDPISCAGCPARINSARLAYLDAHHPADAKTVRDGSKVAVVMALFATSQLRKVIDNNPGPSGDKGSATHGG
jgi:hypothetical protein